MVVTGVTVPARRAPNCRMRHTPSTSRQPTSMAPDPKFNTATGVFHKFDMRHQTKVYIPLRRKTTGVGALRRVSTTTRKFALAIPTCWYLKTYFALPPMRNAKICVTPNANPQREYRCRWNIAGVGHVHFMFLLC